MPNDWSLIMEYFNQNKELKLWNEIYAPLITERAKAVLLDQWRILFNRICTELEAIMNDISDNR